MSRPEKPLKPYPARLYSLSEGNPRQGGKPWFTLTTDQKKVWEDKAAPLITEYNEVTLPAYEKELEDWISKQTWVYALAGYETGGEVEIFLTKEAVIERVSSYQTKFYTSYTKYDPEADNLSDVGCEGYIDFETFCRPEVDIAKEDYCVMLVEQDSSIPLYWINKIPLPQN